MSALEATDFSLSLQELEESDWGKPEPGTTHMVRRCHSLRRKPLDQLTNDELRLALGQEIGIPYILDLAFQRLESNPLLEGGCFPGDILSNLIRARNEVWAERPALRVKLAQHFEFAMQQPEEVTGSFREFLDLPPEGDSVN